MYLRIMVCNFIRTHPYDSFNGLSLEYIFDNNRYGSLEEYCMDNVLKMGAEAQDLVIYLLPVVMRMPIKNVMVDKNANGGFLQTLNLATTDQTKLLYQDSLNFHNPGQIYISLFFRPGHYEILVEMKFMRKMAYFQQTFDFFRQFGYNAKGTLEELEPRERLMTVPAKSASSFQLTNSLTHRFTDIKRDVTITLHCTHTHNQREFLDYLNENYNVTNSIESLFRTKSGEVKQPECSICGNTLSFEDINRLYPGTFKRKEYSVQREKFKKKGGNKLQLSKTTVSYGISKVEEEKEYFLLHKNGDEDQFLPVRKGKSSKFVCIWIALALVMIGFIVLIVLLV